MARDVRRPQAKASQLKRGALDYQMDPQADASEDELKDKGRGLSGTGPKAGGPHYLYRFCAEQTITINTTAAGGNVALLA